MAKRSVAMAVKTSSKVNTQLMVAVAGLLIAAGFYAIVAINLKPPQEIFKILADQRASTIPSNSTNLLGKFYIQFYTPPTPQLSFLNLKTITFSISGDQDVLPKIKQLTLSAGYHCGTGYGYGYGQEGLCYRLVGKADSIDLQKKTVTFTLHDSWPLLSGLDFVINRNTAKDPAVLSIYGRIEPFQGKSKKVMFYLNSPGDVAAFVAVQLSQPTYGYTGSYPQYFGYRRISPDIQSARTGMPITILSTDQGYGYGR